MPVIVTKPAILPPGVLARIHVMQENLQSNRKHGTRLPVYTVKRGRLTYHCRSVRINGASQLVSHEDTPLSCGARLWLQTKAALELSPHGSDVTEHFCIN